MAVTRGRTPAVLVVGDVAVDLVLAIPQFPAPGGDAFAVSLTMALGGCGANVAITLTRLGVRATLAAGVGCDSHGQEALAGLDEAGVDTSAITSEPAERTHLTVIAVTPDGERTIFGHAGASRCLRGDILGSGRAGQLDAVVMSGYALIDDQRRPLAEGIIDQASAGHLPVFLDLPAGCPEPAWESVKGAGDKIGTLIIGADEACRFSNTREPHTAAACLATGKRSTIVTNGPGRVFCACAGRAWEVAPPTVDAVDSTGAGDAFIAAVVAARLHRLGVQESLLAGCAFGAVATTVPGAGSALPGPAEVLKFAARQGDPGLAMSAPVLRWLRSLGGADLAAGPA